MAEEEKTKTINLTLPIIVILLMAASFLVGLSWKEIKGEDLSAKPEEEKKQLVQVSPAPQKLPQKPAVLGEKEIGLIESGGAAVKGNQDAPVTIVEFSEYLCPFCAEYVGYDSVPSRPIDEEKVYRQIMEKYVDTGKIRYIFKDFPVHGNPAIERAAACRCAGEQGKYWQYHDLLFERQREVIKEEQLRKKLKEYAYNLGLNKEKFDLCLDSDKYIQAVKDSYDSGVKVAKIAWDLGLIDHRQVPKRESASLGTPTFFINGHMLVGAQPFANFKAIIEEELGR